MHGIHGHTFCWFSCQELCSSPFNTRCPSIKRHNGNHTPAEELKNSRCTRAMHAVLTPRHTEQAGRTLTTNRKSTLHFRHAGPHSAQAAASGVGSRPCRRGPCLQRGAPVRSCRDTGQLAAHGAGPCGAASPLVSRAARAAGGRCAELAVYGPADPKCTVPPTSHRRRTRPGSGSAPPASPSESHTSTLITAPHTPHFPRPYTPHDSDTLTPLCRPMSRPGRAARTRAGPGAEVS